MHENGTRSAAARRLQGGCNDICHYPADGICDDGGDGSQYDACTLGSDCTDCGARVLGPSAPPAPSPIPVMMFSVSDIYDSGEEQVSTGTVILDSSDLELMTDGGSEQVVGVTFQSVNIEPNEVIESAVVLFRVDEVRADGRSDDDVSIMIQGEASANAAPLSGAAYDLTARSVTTAGVAWTAAPFLSVGEDLYTSDIASIINEIILLPGWAAGNTICILFRFLGGLGNRWVEAYQASASSGVMTPALQIQIRPKGPPMPPPQPDLPPRPPLLPRPLLPPLHPPALSELIISFPACSDLELLFGGAYTLQGIAANGAPAYVNANGASLYHDTDCDGTGNPHAQWLLDSSMPDLTRSGDLDNDGECAASGKFVTNSLQPPVGVHN
eukprot:5728760-Prymnesium_polylepis.1